MIKKILFIGCFSFVTSLSFSQTTEMTLEGTTTNISGTVHTVTITNGNEQIIDILAHNLTGGDKSWKVTRKRITPSPLDWSDYLCWGEEGDPFGGTCYPASAMNMTTWSSGGKMIANNAAGLIAIHINPSDLVNGSCHYRYYVGEYEDTPEDSVDVLVTTTTLAVKEIKANSPVLTTYPNPADNSLTVTLQSNQTEGSIKMTDVLGKVVLEERISGSRKFDVEEFKNGVYVLVLTSNGVSTSKRVVIRH